MSKKILIVDDDPPILKGIEMVLKAGGFTTMATLKGEETIGLIESFQPDILVIDVMLQNIDGRAIAKKIKSNKKTSSLPIIVISANQSYEKDIASYGVDTFIAKPFSSALLLETISKHC